LITEKTGALPALSTPLNCALGRVLRQAMFAPHDLPAFDCSSMDGYAVAADDDSERFRIIGEIQPGTVPEFEHR